MANFKIVPRPARSLPRATPVEKAFYYSDAPELVPVPRQHVKPAPDRAPKWIGEFRDSLHDALLGCDPFAKHVAFYHWRESQLND